MECTITPLTRHTGAEVRGIDLNVGIDAETRAALNRASSSTLCVLLGGVLLHSMNVLITATLLPSIVAELGGANLMSWPTTAFVASSIVAASGTSLVGGRFGNRRAFSGGAVIYAAGALLCAYAPSVGFVIAGRFVQGLGRPALSARLCARPQCISGSALAESFWSARGRLVGHRTDRTSDWRRVRELWALARRVCYGRRDRVPARCRRPFYASGRQAERGDG